MPSRSAADIDNSLKDELADAYRVAGKTAEADKMDNEMIEELSKDANAGNNNFAHAFSSTAFAALPFSIKSIIEFIV